MQEIIELISKGRFSLEEEKVTQQELADLFSKHSISFVREFNLDSKNVIDFYLPELELGIELKIGNKSRRDIYKQLKRYCSFDKVSAILLLTNKSMWLPFFIKDKKSSVINLGKAWV